MTGLRLAAMDAQDLAVLSAILQDAIVPIGDIAYLPDEQCFVAVANRFRWEGEGTPAGPTPDAGHEGERVNCGLRFLGVTRVAYRGFDLRRRDQFLSLLAIEVADDGASLLLRLAGGGDIRLSVERLEVRLADIGEPWPAVARPAHPVSN
ncbi:MULTISPECIES: DUF2948 family protein [unclassified Azospirillum]|uniref:DUF2948 family protein n=1 Tax=unclassified Azospirillum TaxID=2630922 RepID=UPI000B6A1070|nr:MULTISPECIES: DUF2948 family protein [unclassified Azospirillum]SNS23547.1 Protein of unknown function [Azospirillum sp. RU38E]SNS41714.1 Protein of unknown function [Azospirillum sp. RU37A]